MVVSMHIHQSIAMAEVLYLQLRCMTILDLFTYHCTQGVALHLSHTDDAACSMVMEVFEAVVANPHQLVLVCFSAILCQLTL